MSITKIESPTRGLVGFLSDINFSDPASVLIFQLPRQTNMINEEYRKAAINDLKNIIPEGRQVLVIGADVNVYELAGPDAIILKLKGII